MLQKVIAHLLSESEQDLLYPPPFFSLISREHMGTVKFNGGICTENVFLSTVL